ncbi:uncharacterized protein EV420DRAFT_712376 [Desarmillaria tabescens]|uniref:Uncharacterized protein n=1 Tax=Armillaria tabescens TaxID=1929756 RepID=A0AA39JZ55_ARMTA|nr:uncharacterized protein EV420DRAFT_712376 [Desarmillaria tabescens]KAK0451332.1 hypothetical protein EV420DRAFT_712376 [Desarmillaria tabescens]
MIRDFARNLLNTFEGKFTSDTDDYSLKHEWRKLATGHEKLLFALTAPHPSMNEATTRHGVDSLLHQVVRVVSEKQKSEGEKGSVGYQHEVPMAMSKTYTKVPFSAGHELTCDGQATYRLHVINRLAIKKFAAHNNLLTEVTSAARLSLNCDDLCMLVIEYQKSDPTAAVQQLLMDFAAILRHRKLLGFGLEYLMGIVGSHKASNVYELTFYLGTLTDEGYVRHWDIDTLNIANPAGLLQSYVWMINGLSTFTAYAKTWDFDSTAPRDLPELLWRADRSGGSKGSAEHSRKRKRSDSQGRRSSGSGHETGGGGGADNDMRMEEMDMSGAEVESEEDRSEELMDNSYGQRMVTMVDENGISYKVPYYTPSELARCADEEYDEAVFEARERMCAQQDEISSIDKTRRYLDSLRTDGSARFLSDSA